ncbi:MAG: UDP-N-acetylmuramate dehydrogenase [Bacteroidota bacterium]
MITITEQVNLKDYTTFKINCYASFLAEIDTIEELLEFMDSTHSNLPRIVLGGGSNMLFTKNFNGLLLKLNFKGIDVLSENETDVYVRAMAGVKWDDFVSHCVDNNWCGIENLIEIPGNVGSCPIQNIGAYGTEVKDTIYAVEAINIKSKKPVTFQNEDCKFGYRSSIFKLQEKDKYLITSVIFKLSKIFFPNINYSDIQKELADKYDIKIKDVSEAIRGIRLRKLPVPDELGNAGSFFKNPTISAVEYERLKNKFAEIPSFKVDADSYKIPAAWLIEQTGWKGYRDGDAGVHQNQPLVLVNYGKASGLQIKELSEKIKESVFKKFSIQLETEVNIY